MSPKYLFTKLTQPLHHLVNRKKGIVIVLTRRIGPTFPQVWSQSVVGKFRPLFFYSCKQSLKTEWSHGTLRNRLKERSEGQPKTNQEKKNRARGDYWTEIIVKV